MVKSLAIPLILILFFAGIAQQVSPLSKGEAAIRHKVDQLAPRAQIAVIRKDAGVEFAVVVALGALIGAAASAKN